MERHGAVAKQPLFWWSKAIQIRTISLGRNFCRFSKGHGLCAFTDRSFGPTNEDLLWKLQYRIIQEPVEKGPCVIVGRCADFILAASPLIRTSR